MLGVAQVDDSALQADRARAAVEDEVDRLAQLGGDVLDGGRADPARRVGARGDDGQPDLAQESLRRRVRRHPDGHGREAGDGGRGDLRLRGQRQDERQRAGPERLGEAVGAGVEGGDAAGGVASATCAISGLCAGRRFAR